MKNYVNERSSQALTDDQKTYSKTLWGANRIMFENCRAENENTFLTLCRIRSRYESIILKLQEGEEIAQGTQDWEFLERFFDMAAVPNKNRSLKQMKEIEEAGKIGKALEEMFEWKPIRAYKAKAKKGHYLRPFEIELEIRTESSSKIKTYQFDPNAILRHWEAFYQKANKLSTIL